MPKITKRFIESKVIRPKTGQVIYRDTQLKGFALRATSGSISYIVEYRVNAVRRRMTIGRHGPLTPKAARQEAQKLLAAAAIGHDLKADEVKLKIADVTLAEVLDSYLSTRTLRENSIRSFEGILRRCLSDWLQKPIASITKEMVVVRHRELTRVTKFGTTGKVQANMAMERLSILINFAANNYEIGGQPIILFNPVKRLSQLRAWHKTPRRQTIIPDHRLRGWYQALLSSKNKAIRDYLLVLVFTGLRRNEAATLRWCDIDFDAKVLTVRASIAKNHREHRLPLSEFLCAIFLRRRAQGEWQNSDYVFPGRGGREHLSEPGYAVKQITKQIGFKFLIHDLRRVFLTTAEKLDVPHYALKKLANHVTASDVTAGYIIVDVERLRVHMIRISDHLIALLGASIGDLI